MREKVRNEGVRFPRRQEFSVFINNIPERLDQHGLKGIFQKAGKVSDTYIPEGKVDRSRKRYGFVLFWHWQEARRSVQMLNNANIKGCKIRVAMEKFAKGGSRLNEKLGMKGRRKFVNHLSQIWRKKQYSTEKGRAGKLQLDSDI